MSSKLVERRLNDLKHRFGDAALELAYYAALPVALNPELLLFLRINFFPQLPYIVEFAFFTSGLCDGIDVELYEIKPETRKFLLQKWIKKESPGKIRQVATLLWQYVEYHSPWAEKIELERAQQLTALYFLNRKKAQEWVETANPDNSQNRGSREWFIAMLQEVEELKEVEKSIDDDPDDPKDANYYYKRGRAYRKWKDYDRAIADYNKAIELDPDYADAYFWRGWTYKDLKNYDRAIADHSQALKLNPNYAADAYVGRGVAYHLLKDYDRAIADYNKAIELEPNNADAYNGRGYTYYHLKEYDRALADCNQALKLNPNDANAYDSRGCAYYGLKDYDHAIADYNKALKLDPNHTIAYYHRGRAYNDKGIKDKAIEDFKKVLELNDDVELNQKAQEQLKELGAK